MNLGSIKNSPDPERFNMAHTTVNSGFFSGGTHFLTPIDGSVNHGHTLRLAPEVELEAETKVETEAAETEVAEVTEPVKRVRVRSRS